MIDETTAALESIKANQAEMLEAIETMKTAANAELADFYEELKKRQLEIVFDLEAMLKNE